MTTGRVHVDGVTVVPGASAHRWRTSLPTDVLTGDQVEAAWGALDRQVRSGDAQKLQGVEPTPKSVGQMTGTAMLTATAAALGFIASAWLLRLTGALPTWAAGSLILAAAGLPLRRSDRWLALGWQTGLAGALLMGAAGLSAAGSRLRQAAVPGPQRRRARLRKLQAVAWPGHPLR